MQSIKGSIQPMKNYFRPTYFLNSYQDVDASFLKKHRIKIVLSDLDGTLASENEMGDSQFELWVQGLKESGVQLIVVSNNNQQRVDEFINKYQVEGYGRCKKPLSKKIESLLEIEGSNRSEILFLGDQIFTDIWCGKIMKVQTAIVTPIPGKETWKTLVKRRPEKWLFKMWHQIR